MTDEPLVMEIDGSVTVRTQSGENRLWLDTFVYVQSPAGPVARPVTLILSQQAAGELVGGVKALLAAPGVSVREVAPPAIQ